MLWRLMLLTFLQSTSFIAIIASEDFFFFFFFFFFVRKFNLSVAMATKEIEALDNKYRFDRRPFNKHF